MHDLRKKILMESGKTVSRKARSRPESHLGSASHSPLTSPAHSRPGSRANSRPGSRYASEDEGFDDMEFDDSMTMSTNSVSDADVDTENQDWVDRLKSRMLELEDRKRSNGQTRVMTLTAYLHLLRHHYARSQISGSILDIVSSLMKSIKSGASADERTLALRSLAVATLTCPSESIFELTYSTLKGICEDAEEESVKVEALHAMSVVVIQGGGSEDAASDLLEFLIAIIESDGHTVDAPDSGIVVAAALEAWGFVASHVDLADHSEQAMEAFIEQLDSADAGVQTSAGSNIALLFEAAREYEEETGETMNLPYDPKKLIARMSELARGSKSISKRDRRTVRSNFSSVATSLELGKGPGWSTAGRPASNPHTGGSKVENDNAVEEFGYREKIRVHNRIMTIDTWALMARVELLRALLGGGMPTHILENPTVQDILSNADIEHIASPGTPSKKGRKGRNGWE